MKGEASKIMGVKRSVFMLLFLFFAVLPIFAQSEVSGIVKDEKGVEVIGATVKVKGATSGGAITDYNGAYTLKNVSTGATLVIAYIGMETQEVPIANAKSIVLKEVSKEMTDLVVVGYGPAVERRDLVATVTSAGGKEIKDIPVTSVGEALEGKLAGVQITTTEGSPDAEVKIRVRGGGSINLDNSPLYVVDGFPVDDISDIPPSNIESVDVLKDASATAIYGSRGANGVILITTKNPSKDQKFSVNYNGYFGWKKVSKTLDVLTPGDFARWNYELEAMRGGTNMSNYFSKYFNPTGGSLNTYTVDQYNQLMSQYDAMSANDWQKKIFGITGKTQSHNFTISAGGEKTNYSLSYGHIADKAIMLGSDYTQDNLNFKLKSSPAKFIDINFAANFSDTKVKGSGANDVNSDEKSTADSRLASAVIYTPVLLHDYTSGDPSLDIEDVGNIYPPDSLIYNTWKQTHKINYSYNGSIAATVIKGLVLKSELGIYNSNLETDRFYGPISYPSRTYPVITYDATGVSTHYTGEGIVTTTNLNTSRLRNSNTISYVKNNIGKKRHNLSVLLGEETVSTQSNTTYTEVAGLPSYLNYANAFANTTLGTYVAEASNLFETDDNLLSFFGRANYDYKGLYYLTATMRADGSSRFAPNDRWGYFPSVAGAWRISDEKFIKNKSVSKWLNNLKLRLSWGTVGNNNIPTQQYYNKYNPTVTAYIPSLSNVVWSASTILPNKDLIWETTTTRNFGIDYGFLKNRISGSLDMYYNNTYHLLMKTPLYGSGYLFQYQNIGSTQNIGIEYTLNGVIIDKKNFGLNVSANISMNRGKVVELGNGVTQLAASSAWGSSNVDPQNDYIVEVGKPVGMMYGYVSDGRYSANDFTWNGSKWIANPGVVKNSDIDGVSWGPGALKLKDLDGDGVITSADQTIIGNANPKATGGFTLNARAYDFDLSANFNWVYGNNVYNANKIEFTCAGSSSWYGRNMTSEMAAGNRWTNIDPLTGQLTTDVNRLNELNATTTLWSPALQKYVFQSWAVEDGSFLRLSSLTIGYSVPKKLLKKIYVQQFRVYVSGTNLFCLTKYTGYDPEVDTRRSNPVTPGVDFSAYPKSRSYNIGVNIGF